MAQVDQSTRGGRVKFDNPPVNELVIGLYHLPIAELRVQHIGLYWKLIQDRYPICEQQNPIGGSPEDAFWLDRSGEVFPLPRFWFRSTAHPMLIQLQRNAFILNWRHLQNNQYPHYESVEDEFWKAFEIYKTFIQDQLGAKFDVVKRCELTYINLIIKNRFFSNSAEIMKVIPALEGVCKAENPGRRLVGLNSMAVYQIHNNLFIDVTSKLGRRKDSSKEQVAILEIKAHGSPDDLSFDGAKDWFRKAHESTYETFLAFTDERVRRELWRPR